MALEKVTTESGLTIYNDRIAGAKTNNVSVFLPYGSVHEQPGHEGVAHVFEHCVHLETDQFPSTSAVSNYVDHAGMDHNAITSYARTLYYANGLEVEPNLNFLSQILQHPHFPADMVKQELKAVRREIASDVDNTDRMHVLASRNAIFGHPYGRSVGGHHGKIDFDSETLKDLHERYYKLGNMALVVSGNIRTNDLVELANRYFQNEGEQSTTIEEPAAPVYGVHHRTGFVRENTHSLNLGVSYPMSPEFRNKFNQERVVMCMALIAMSGHSLDRLRFDEGISYDGGIMPVIHNHPNAWTIDGGVTIDSENTAKAEAIFDEVFAKTGKHYADERLEGIIASQKYELAKVVNTVDGHSDGILSQLSSYIEPHDMRTMVPKLKKITTQDVRDAIDTIVNYVAETPRYTHLTGTRAAIGDVERIIEQDEIS